MVKDGMNVGPSEARSRRRWLGRLAGFILIGAGISLFYYLTTAAVSHGLLAAWLAIWPIVALIGVGGFLALDYGLTTALRLLTMALSVLMPWSLIFFVPLPGDSQGLLAVLVAAVGVFVYWRYSMKRKSSPRGESRDDAKQA
jgi:hypothetical protein